MVDVTRHDWDERLQAIIETVPESELQPFSLLEIRAELQQMRCRSAVGPDGIGVHLLREIASHDSLGPQLRDLVNHIVGTLELPHSWEKSFLALLAKCKQPKPISVSSAFNKLVNRLVCSRTLPVLRKGSRVSACGAGRQAADLIGCATRIRDVVHEWKLPCLLCKLDVAGAFDRVDRYKVADLLCSRLLGRGLCCELRYLLSQLRVHTLQGRVPGGDLIEICPNNGIKQGAPESAEIFGLVVEVLLAELAESRQWKAMGRPYQELEIDLMFYQNDIFLVDDKLPVLGKRIRAIDKCLQQAGLRLATNKTKVVASDAYRGCRRTQIGSDLFNVAPQGESLKVLGLSFSFGHPNEQAKELLARSRAAAAAAHRDVINARGAWGRKISMIRSLVESQWSWTAGAVHWSSDDLRSANLQQLHTLRSAFALRRLSGETWVDWNARTLRFCRVWLVNNQVPRWSEKILALQHNLFGHWARRTEADHQGRPCASLPLRALLWRSTHWWRQQQSLPSSIGLRHPGRFYASNTERQISESHGSHWQVAAQDRLTWANSRSRYVQMWDVKWSSGRQLALRF